MNETVKEAVFRLRTLSYDLNTLQNRIISVLFDILYDTNLEAKPVPRHIIGYLEENREFMKRLLADIDIIIRKLKSVTEQKEE
jgi:hypothetical protein